MQTAFTLVFFCAFHDFLRIWKEKRRSNDATDGEVPLIAMRTQGTGMYVPVCTCTCICLYMQLCIDVEIFVRTHNANDVHVEDAGDETAPTTVVQKLGSELLRSAHALLSNYWVLVVVAAFLLVSLSGEPNMLKTVYLIFFFVFLITYQVSLMPHGVCAYMYVYTY